MIRFQKIRSFYQLYISPSYKRFVGRAGIVLLGSLLGQGIAFLTLPFVTHLYTPVVLGRTASILSLISISALLICFQYDQAIIVADNDDIPFVFTLGLLGIFFWTFIICSILILEKLVNSSKLADWGINWSFLGLLFTYGLFVLLLNVSLRSNAIYKISLGRVMYYGGGSIFQLVGGYLFGGNTNVYLWSQVVALLFAIAILLPQNFVVLLHPIKTRNVGFLRAIAKKYSNFPKYLIGGGVANAVSIHLPQIFLRVAFGDAWAGWYFVAQRIISAPTALLSQAIGQIFYRDSAEKERYGLAQAGFLEQVVIGLVKVSFLPGIIMGMFAPLLINFTLGIEWISAANILQILIVSALISFVVSPISFTLNVKGLQREDFFFKSLLFVFRFIGLFLGWQMGNAYASITLYVLSTVIILFFYLLYILKSVNGNLKRILKQTYHIFLLAIILVLVATIINQIEPMENFAKTFILVLIAFVICVLGYSRDFIKIFSKFSWM